MSETEAHLILAHFPDIQGAVTVPGYEGWVQLETVQWGLGMGVLRPGDVPNGADGQPDETQFPRRQASTPSVSEVSVMKPTGPESGKILFNAFTKKGMDVTIVFLTYRDRAKSTSPTLGYVRTSAHFLHHVILSGYSRNANANRDSNISSITETLSLNYGGIETTSYGMNGEPVDSILYHMHTGTTTYKTWNAAKNGFEVVLTEKSLNEFEDD